MDSGFLFFSLLAEPQVSALRIYARHLLAVLTQSIDGSGESVQGNQARAHAATALGQCVQRRQQSS